MKDLETLASSLFRPVSTAPEVATGAVSAADTVGAVDRAEIQLLVAALRDPLVVNFEGTAAELSQAHFELDLDVDGAADQIHFVGPNSGFLALDSNGNGRVDDGTELFGPSTGRGFSELPVHDVDANQWIDEQDSIHAQLRVWTRDQLGNDQLVAVGQRGIGAIYLGHVATPFQVRDEGNALQAEVRDTGIRLRDDCGAGTVQQLDLVV